MDAKASTDQPPGLDATSRSSSDTNRDQLRASQLRQIVERFYEAVLADDLLHDSFEGASMERLQRMQVELFAAALDGRPMLAASQLQDAHARLGLGLEQVSRFFEHLVDTLAAFDVDPELVDRLISRLEPYVDDVVGRHGEGG
jgi:truncated hemoglobin YjbI